MKAPHLVLLLALALVTGLSSCNKDNGMSAAKRSAAEDLLGTAAWDVERTKNAASSPGATQADGVDYADAKRRLEIALADARSAGVENPGLIVSKIREESRKQNEESAERIKRIKAGILTN